MFAKLLTFPSPLHTPLPSRLPFFARHTLGCYLRKQRCPSRVGQRWAETGKNGMVADRLAQTTATLAVFLVRGNGI